MRKGVPHGIELIFYVYILNVVFFISSLALFESRVLILGKEANVYLTWLVRLCLIFIPVYLALRLINLKKDGWILAVLFHAYFIINNATGFIEGAGFGRTLVRITGVYGLTVYSPTQIFVIILNTLLNVFILWYLLNVKSYFFKAIGGENV